MRALEEATTKAARCLPLLSQAFAHDVRRGSHFERRSRMERAAAFLGEARLHYSYTRVRLTEPLYPGMDSEP